MKKILTLCFLWAMSIALWGQTYGYGGDFNPDSPDNPKEPSVTYKYDLKLTTDGGGNVNSSPSGTQFVAGTEIYLNANPNTGYKFRCWMQGDSVISVSQWHYYTMPAKDVEIRAIFAFEPEVPDNPNAVALKYRVTVEASPSNAGYVNCNSEKVSVGDYAYVSASCNSGYQFKGWMLDGKKVSESSYYNFPMESRNMHFIALFEFNPDAPGNPSNNPTNEQTYTIKYTIDGLVCHTEALPAGAAITAIAEPTKKGHSFSGWQNLPTLMPASDLVVTGTFTPNTYHITYKIEGIVFHDEDVVYGSVLTPPSVEGKEGHTLTWTNLPSAMPDYDVVVEGVYTLNKYKLTYIVDGEVYKSYDVLYASVITPETAPTKEGYTFSGWKDVPETMPANDVVVTGYYNVNKYLITFKIGDEVIASDSLAYGSAIVAPEAPAKEGHTFGGWKDVPETMPANDVVVTGSYNVNKYLITFKIGDEVIASDSLAYGSAIVAPEAPVKEGHTFSGWKDIPETMPANDVVVAGSFSVNNYTVKYMLDGVEFKTESVAYGSNIPHPEVPAKEGHTFGGWIDAPKTMPANDIVVTGSYTVNKYLITFKIGDEVIVSDSLAYGSVIVAPEAPAKEGHTFSGWSDIPETMPAEDVTVTGSFAVNKYKLTYVVDGNVFHTDSVAYGSRLSAIDEPVKDGRTFSGWVGLPEFMPAKDVTVTGSFVTNGYKLTYMVDGEIYKTIVVEYGTAITPEEAPVKEGHTFSGWSDIPETMPAEDVTVTGSFTVNKYKLTYVVDGAEYHTDFVAYGSKLTAIEVPVKEGHTFSGWDNVPETMPAKDVVVTGSYTVNKYLITFKIGDEVIASDSLAYGSAIVPPEAPVKEGHTFSGWKDVPETMPANDVVVAGSFSVNNYTVKYMLDGVEFKTESVAYGSNIPHPEVPAKEGHTFGGWIDAPKTMPANDIVVTGSYNVNKYLITFKIGDEVIASDSLAYGSVIVAPEAPAKEGHTFSGWKDVPETMPANDVVVAGSFSVNNYTVKYMLDGVEFKTESVAYGSNIPHPEVPAKEGHTFGGWIDAPKTMPANDIVVTGSYTVNKYLITFKIGDEVIVSDSLAYGSVIVAPEAPAKEGHTFNGWSDIPEMMPAEDVTVTGSFAVNKYKLTYVVDGNVFHTDSVAYGSRLSAIDEPVKDGCTFSGWVGLPEFMPAKDVTVTGSFVTNGYKLTYMVDGEIYKTIVVEYGTAITPEEAPVKEGHTFSGWSDIPETMPAEDVTVTGLFTVNKYKLTYVVDGAEYHTDSVAYGSKLTAIEVPVKEGHTFSGWDNVPETMPAKDVVVTGSYTVNKYLITFKIGDEVIASDSLAYGSVIVAPEAPEREGHTFIGWGEVLQYVPAHDVTFVGCYTVNIYKVYYYVGEELVHTEEVAYGAAMPSYEYEPSNGDIFNGWEGEHYETMPAHDVTYVANITSSISMLQVAGRNMVVYDFNGRRIYDLNTLKSGLYIVNGKRMLVK